MSSDVGGRGGLQHRRDHAEVDDRVRLDQCAVEHPRVARAHPADRVGVHAAPQQPDAAVGRGLAGAHDDVLAGRLLQVHEVVDRDDASAVPDGEPWRLLGRDVRSQVTRIDDPAALRYVERLARDPRDDGAAAQVRRAGEELDPPRPEQPVGQHVRVVREDRRLPGPLVQPRLGPPVLHPPTTEQRRRDAVEARGLVQLHERVRLQPVAADAVPPVDERHPGRRGVLDQRVRERHPHRAGPDHEVVGFDAARHGVTVLDGGGWSAEEHGASGLDTLDGDGWTAGLGPHLPCETKSIGHEHLVASGVLGDPVAPIAQPAGDAL